MPVANTSAEPTRGTNPSAHVIKAPESAATAAVPPTNGSAQHAAQAPPMPKSSFQSLMKFDPGSRARRPRSHCETSSNLRCKRIRSARGRTRNRTALAHNVRMDLLKTFALFVVTALAEIVGCYLPYLWLRQGRSAWLLVPAFASLALFTWLLTLHPTAAGRVYAAYGGVYVSVAILWLWTIDRVQPTTTDWIGVAVSLLGMAIIVAGPRAMR